MNSTYKINKWRLKKQQLWHNHSRWARTTATGTGIYSFSVAHTWRSTNRLRLDRQRSPQGNKLLTHFGQRSSNRFPLWAILNFAVFFFFFLAPFAKSGKNMSVKWWCLVIMCTINPRWFWPDLMNVGHDHTTAVCVSLPWSGGLRLVRLPARKFFVEFLPWSRNSTWNNRNRLNKGITDYS